MKGYEVCTDYTQIIAGTVNFTSPVYREASKNIEEGTSNGMNYLKNFLTSIENLASKESTKDARITSSKGNIKNFSGYENIKLAMEFLTKNLGKIDIVKSLTDIFNSVESYQVLYTEAYNKNIRLIILEYESAVYILVTGIVHAMAERLGVFSNGNKVQIKKRSTDDNEYAIISDMVKKMAKELTNKNHRGYLDDLIKAKNNGSVDTDIKESTTFMEASVLDTLALIKDVGKAAFGTVKTGIKLVGTFKNSLFGIIPLIRSILYLKYKKKADTVLALEQNIEFIKQNIERLENMQNMDEHQKKKIIYKQQAAIERYQKRAEKLRAQLIETEKEVATEIKDEDSHMKDNNDDFILEMVGISSEIEEV